MLPLPPFEWIAPRTLDAALDALAAAPGESLLLAGGTDAVPNLKRGLGSPRRVIGLGAIAELARIEPLDDGGLWLGAGLTLDRIARDPLVSERYPALAAAAASAASPQVRRMGTLGGNLCLDTRCAYYDQSAFWRGALGHCLKTTGDVCHVAGGRRCVAALAADTPAPLIAYQAIVELRSRRGVRRLPLLELYGSDGAHHLTRAPDEIVTGVELPAPAAGLTSSYLKLRARGSIDFPLLSVAAAVDARDARVVIAALGPRPRLVRLSAAAAADTASRPLSAAAVEAIAGAARAQCHPLANLGAEGWRTELVPTMVKRALATLVTLVAMIAPAYADVLGVVRDEAGQPVSGARVSREASGAAVTTGVDGAFVLPSADGAITIVAAARGYFHASTQVTSPASGVVLTVAAVPLADDVAYRFQSPAACAACHERQVAEWEGSPMARAGQNTWVYDLFDGSGTSGGSNGFVYTRDSMLADHNPASECASCHQPEPWAASPFSPLVPVAQAGGQHGVSCEVCHRIAAIDEAKVNFPGLYPGVVRMARTATFAPVQFGLLGDVAFVAGAMRPSFQPQLAAAVCAACHQDKNDPDDDGDFEEEGGVISEPTYLEWLASSYADPSSPDHATCVDCHMPATGETAACTVYTPSQPRPAGQLRSHRIEGTTAAFLDEAVSVRVSAAVDGDEVVVDVELENDGTGHHVPTGVTVRNMILLVVAHRHGDALPLVATGDQIVDELGGVGDPSRGYFAGLPGKLYAKVPIDAAGNGPVFFTEAAGLARDNRIAAHAIDRTTYRFAIPAGGGEIMIDARVIYRRAFRAVVDAKGWTTDGHGGPLEDLAPPYFGHLMATASATIDAPPPESGCGCGGGGALAGLLTALAGLPLVRRATPPRSSPSPGRCRGTRAGSCRDR